MSVCSVIRKCHLELLVVELDAKFDLKYYTNYFETCKKNIILSLVRPKYGTKYLERKTSLM